jgi:hypothetical protein
LWRPQGDCPCRYPLNPTLLIAKKVGRNIKVFKGYMKGRKGYRMKIRRRGFPTEFQSTSSIAIFTNSVPIS